MKPIFLLLLINYCLLISCNQSPKELKKGLPLVILKAENAFKNFDSSGNEGLVIRFYENGTYSHFAYNFFAYGNWKWNEEKKKLTLTPTFSKDSLFDQQFKIEKKDVTSYSIKKVINQDGKTLIERNEHAAIGLSSVTAKDPFSKEINTWRIKPKKTETLKEIKTRTLSYLQFLVTYHEFIKENKIDIYVYSWYATPIQMHYGNGVRMAYSDELTDWYACFYAVEEANEAYKLLGGALRKSKLKNIENKAERNADYVRQLIEAIK